MPSASIAADFAAAAATRVMLRDPLSLLRATHVEPHPWQAQMLTSRAQQIILFCSRQAGKSLVTSAFALHTAMTQANSDILVVSRAQRQAINLLRTAMRIYFQMGKPVASLSESKQTLELTNRSRIIALPGSSESIRSFSALRMLIIDEGAFVPDELYMSVRPMLAVGGGRLVALSSAYGKRGWFYEAWKGCEDAKQLGERPDWEQYRVPATDCPHISPEFLAQERRAMGDWWYRQEYGAEFLDAATSVFRGEDIEAALDPSVDQWELPAWAS